MEIFHHEDRVLFQEAINLTAAETGFSRELIEKDYFASLVLDYFSKRSDDLVFKGGTCIAKVHAGFSRLSEDIDFTIPVNDSDTRKTRRGLIANLKETTKEKQPLGLYINEPLRGANQSKQYMCQIGYRSLLTDQEQSIKVDISLREPLLLPTKTLQAQTLLINPINGNQMVSPIKTKCIDFKEAIAEKFRAALTRKEAAIRDYYDIDFAIQNLGLDTEDKTLQDLIRSKLSILGKSDIIPVSDLYPFLESQLAGRLKPVLRSADYQAFDLQRACQQVDRFATLDI